MAPTGQFFDFVANSLAVLILMLIYQYTIAMNLSFLQQKQKWCIFTTACSTTFGHTLLKKKMLSCWILRSNNLIKCNFRKNRFLNKDALLKIPKKNSNIFGTNSDIAKIPTVFNSPYHGKYTQKVSKNREIFVCRRQRVRLA